MACDRCFGLALQTRTLSEASKSVSLGQQVSILFLLAIPIACIAWTLTHEAIFREPREFCKTQSENAKPYLQRKFFYIFTCEYCLSHYVTAVILAITRFQLIYGGWRGYLISLFSLVWIANCYMSIYDRLRLTIKHEHVAIDADKKQAQSTSEQRTKKAA